jgi:adenylate cyclase
MAFSFRSFTPDFHLGWAPLVVALGGLIFNFVPWRAVLEEDVGLSLLYALRGTEVPPAEIVIIGIDDKSAMALEVPEDREDWPRRLHARLIRNAQAMGAELLAFDVYFSGPSGDPAADREMAEALRSHGASFLTNFVKLRQAAPGIYVESVMEPVAGLQEAARATAPFLLPANGAEEANRFLTFFAEEERQATLPLLLYLAHILKTDPGTLSGAVAGFDPGLAFRIAGRGPRAQEAPDLNALALRLAQNLRFRPEANAALNRAVKDPALSAASRRTLRSIAHVFRGERARFFRHYGPARTFPTIPYHELVDGSSKLPSLAGKILLVGYLENFQTEELSRQFRSPFSEISSVELLATALGNLIEGRQVAPALPPVPEAWWLVAWGAALGGLAQSRAAVRGIALILAAGAGYLAVAWFLFRNDGLWLPLVVPLGWQVPAALLMAASVSFQRRASRERRMHSVIQRFIPADMFSHMAGQTDDRALPAYGRLARGVCLATDAGRYTALAEVLEPMELARLMNSYYEAIFEPVARRGGWVSDVIGDAMLAIWIGEGEALEERQDALAAALEILDAVKRFERERGLDFPIRMGLHFGELRVGYVGTVERGEIRAVGDTVNTAARLETLNKSLGTHILASESLLDGLAGLGIRPLGSFLLAGKSRALGVAELVSRGNAGPQPEALFNGFGKALALFSQGLWPEAHAAFTLLLQQFPEDGPARFFRNLCQAYLINPELARAEVAVDKVGPALLPATLE